MQWLSNRTVLAHKQHNTLKTNFSNCPNSLYGTYGRLHESTNFKSGFHAKQVSVSNNCMSYECVRAGVGREGVRTVERQ